jgi:hypothetical protein
VQWHVLRNEKLAAARDGRRIHQALTQALALAPGLDDAYFGLGMYKYYADVAPAAARILRFLLLLPGGDREEGLAEMLRARDRGQLLQGEADYQIHIVYLWYEQRVDGALELLRGLQAEYPRNPLFLAQIAQVQDGYQHDVAASLATWRALLTSARAGRVEAAPLAEAQARLGIAAHLDRLFETDRALEHLEAVAGLGAAAPYGARALALLQAGQAHDRLGARDQALAAYRAAIAAAPSPDPQEIRSRAADHLRRAPNARAAHAYRLSIEGLRALERQDLTAAAAALERSLAQDPQSRVARSRYARVLDARGDPAEALGQFERAIAAKGDMPPVILGDTYLRAAQLHERAGRAPQAATYYRIVSTLFGAAAETRADAVEALARIDAH